MQLRDLHREFPGMMIYQGPGSCRLATPRSVPDRLHERLLVQACTRKRGDRTLMVWPVGNMLWRIGDILPVMDQIVWCREAGFDGIGLHASAGRTGSWEGVDPTVVDPSRRRQLRQALSGFAWREVHAPFEIVLRRPGLAEAVAHLQPILAFGSDLDAEVVSVHAEIPDDAAADGHWVEQMSALEVAAAEWGLAVGLEVVSGFDAVGDWSLPHIGVTLDVGHMYGVAGGRPLEPFGTIGEVVRQLGSTLVHLHVHDVESTPSTAVGDLLDHTELGTGRVDVDGLLSALHDVGYSGGLCLEMNPDRVSPEGIRRSLDLLRQKAIAWPGTGS